MSFSSTTFKNYQRRGVGGRSLSRSYLIQAQHPGRPSGDQFIIACQYLYLNPCLRQKGKGLHRRVLRRVIKGNITKKDELAFVFHCKDLFVPWKFTICNPRTRKPSLFNSSTSSKRSALIRSIKGYTWSSI